MNSYDIALIFLTAIVCGTLAQLTSGYSKGGWIVNLVVGFLGALAGVLVSRSLNAPVIYDLAIRNTRFPVIYSVVGAVIFLAGIGLFIRPGRQ